MVVRSIVLSGVDDTVFPSHVSSHHSYDARISSSIYCPFVFRLTCVPIELQNPTKTHVDVVFVFASATPIYQPPKLLEASPAQVDACCSVDSNRASTSRMPHWMLIECASLGNNGLLYTLAVRSRSVTRLLGSRGELHANLRRPTATQTAVLRDDALSLTVASRHSARYA